MSHISKIELKIHSLEDLKMACKNLGFQFIENQKTFKWYGRWIGNTPLPDNVNEKDFGKCNHAIRVPNCLYEVGVLKQDDHYILLLDEWKKGGLKKVLGNNAGILKQAYSIVRIKNEAIKKRYRIKQKKIQNGIRISMTLQSFL